MYQHYFRLQQAPFSIAPDPRYLYLSERHREALAHLLYGLGSGGGFVLLTGEIGAGKTTVCRCFMEQLPAGCRLAYIFNPKLSVEELLLSICDEFGIAPGARAAAGVKHYVDAINSYLLESHAHGRNNVLVIDEAQNLSPAVLEQLRLLTNLETSERKLLQIILIGQPELRVMLARPELEQLAQRVIARYHLGPLSAAETGRYIEHRLAVAGATASPPFPPALLGQLHRLSQGVPRRINLLCDRAMLGAYVENQTKVTRAILRKAAAEVGVEASRLGWTRGRAGGRQLLAGVLIGVTVGGAMAWQVLEGGAHKVARATGVALKPAAGTPAAAGMPLPLEVAPGPDVLAGARDGGGEALRQLATLWGHALPAGEPCQVAAREQLRCLQTRGSLAELRRLDRPAVLTLHDDVGAPNYVLLTGMGPASATITTQGKPRSVSLAALAARYDGAYTTFWRAPRGWRDEVSDGDQGPDVDWLARRLAQLYGLKKPPENQPLDTTLQRRLREFQATQHLKADGVAGPKTFIRLYQLAGVQEPKLQVVR